MPQHHHVARAVRGTLLFHTWHEGLVLWRLLQERAPGSELVLMPDHLHLLAERAVPLAGAVSSYARWRNHARGERGPVWRPMSAPTVDTDDQKIRRTRRYVWLNPCRAGLVTDPLAWPLSTYRDAMGLASPPTRERAAEPERLHRYVTRDDTVNVGSVLPFGNGAALVGDDGLRAVEAPVSEVTRTPFSSLRLRGPARTLLVVAARKLVDAPVERIATFAAVDARTVRRLAGLRLPALAQVERLLLDDRFPGLPEADLRQLASWRGYVARRRRGPEAG